MDNSSKPVNSLFLNVAMVILSFLSAIVIFQNMDFANPRDDYSVIFLPIATLFLTGIEKLLTVNKSRPIDKCVRGLSWLAIGGCVLLLSVLLFEYLDFVKMEILENQGNELVFKFVGNLEPINEYLFEYGIYISLRLLIMLYILLVVLQLSANLIHKCSNTRKQNRLNELP